MTATDLVDLLQNEVPSGEKRAAQDVANLVLRLLDYPDGQHAHGAPKKGRDHLPGLDGPFREEKVGNKQTRCTGSCA